MPTSTRPAAAPVALALLTTLVVASCFDSHGLPPETAGPPAGLRLLTRSQYVRSVREALALPETSPVGEVGDFFGELDAAEGAVELATVESYFDAAFAIAEAAVDDPAQRAVLYGGCTPSTAPDDACARAIVAAVGRRAFRRRLTDEELTLFSGLVASIGVSLEDVNVGVAMALAGILQAPAFLYRVELPETDTSERRRPYDADALATRLSYFLWDAPPDGALLDAAERGALRDEARYAEIVDRMVADARVRDGVDALVADLFLTERQRCIAEPCPEAPALGAQLVATVSPALLERGFSAMLTTRTVAMSDEHAAFYGRAPGSLGPSLAPVTLGDAEVRVGALGTPAFATGRAEDRAPSTVSRGLFVVERLLCDEIGPPPADPVHAAGMNRLVSAREALAPDTAAECAGCHERIDAVGLGLERFDGSGRFRERGVGGEIDPSGVLDGVAFADERGLAAVIAAHSALSSCISSHFLSRAIGTATDARNADVMAVADDEARAVLAAVARSDVFRLTVGEAP